MREIRTSGSEGGGAGYSTGSPYPYQERRPPGSRYGLRKVRPKGRQNTAETKTAAAPSLATITLEELETEATRLVPELEGRRGAG
jgi:hypothetical protein